jgi:hypothetical protein
LKRALWSAFLAVRDEGKQALHFPPPLIRQQALFSHVSLLECGKIMPAACAQLVVEGEECGTCFPSTLAAEEENYYKNGNTFSPLITRLGRNFLQIRFQGATGRRFLLVHNDSYFLSLLVHKPLEGALTEGSVGFCGPLCINSQYEAPNKSNKDDFKASKRSDQINGFF